MSPWRFRLYSVACGFFCGVVGSWLLHWPFWGCLALGLAVWVPIAALTIRKVKG